MVFLVVDIALRHVAKKSSRHRTEKVSLPLPELFRVSSLSALAILVSGIHSCSGRMLVLDLDLVVTNGQTKARISHSRNDFSGVAHPR